MTRITKSALAGAAAVCVAFSTPSVQPPAHHGPAVSKHVKVARSSWSRQS